MPYLLAHGVAPAGPDLSTVWAVLVGLAAVSVLAASRLAWLVIRERMR